MTRRFVTLFRYDLEAVLIFKDLGQIPLAFSRWGYQSRLAGFWRDPSCSAMAEPLGFAWVDSRRFRTLILFLYLLRNARKIDFLNLYFWGRDTFFLGRLYKWLNPRGFLYIKTDVIPTLVKNSKLRSESEQKFIQAVDAVSVETSRALGLFRELFPQLGERLLWLPNGVDPELLSHFPEVPKEKIILSVGSIGRPVKNHPLLVEAFLGMQRPDWKLVFCGSVDPAFEEWIQRHPGKPLQTGRVVLTGPTLDRKVLAEWYAKASVFCLPSNYESYGIALVESLCFGACAVGSDTIESIEDLVAKTGMVEVFKSKDPVSLAQALERGIARSEADAELLKARSLEVRRQFAWNELLAPLKALSERDRR